MVSFSGEFTLRRSPPEVYKFLADPACLTRCIPGLKGCEIQDSKHYAVTLQVGLGRVRGPIRLALENVEARECSHIRVLGKGTMLRSNLQVEGWVTLGELPGGATCVKWAGHAKLGAYLSDLVGPALDGLVQGNVRRFVRALEIEMDS